MWNCCFIIYFCAVFPFQTFSFNIEINHYSIYKGDVQSMFGFSVAEYRDKNQRGWVIVGAPLNETKHAGIEKGGAVFRCDIADDNRCFPVEFDKKGINYVKSQKGVQPIDDKSYQWFGATIATSMTDGGPILVCAPKYNWFGYIKTNWSVAGFKDAVGACWLKYLSDGLSAEYSPCRNNDTAGHHRQGMCQAGFAAAVTKDGKRLFIGAPGSWYWQGQMFTISSNVTLQFVPSKGHNAWSKEGSNLSHEQIDLMSTKEGPPSEDNNYLGYSTAVGDFMGNGDSGVAVGVPRGSELHGKVLLFTSQLYNHQNITGEQMGAYFGYALAVSDIDGDNHDDLIVTAPFYTHPENSGIKIETGRIYVFYQSTGVTKYEKFDIRDGKFNRGQFGLSVASLGDIDLDGYGDFVVGEPYGGQENRGAIYVYHGSKDGVESKYSQVIYSEDLEKPIRTFGWSVSGGLDLDGNHYPDLVVGAYESSTVIYFRSRPVINMVSELNFLSESINLKKKTCVLSDGTSVACSELKVCCMYNGLGSWTQHDFIINILLDGKKKQNPRLFFLDFENKHAINWTVTLVKDQLYCQQFKVYVSPNLRDKLMSLDAEVNIELSRNSNKLLSYWNKRDPKAKLSAILGPKNIQRRDSLIIQKNCGSDNICIPDLVLNVAKNVEKYLLGSGEIFQLDVMIQNIAEDAFETVFYLHLPMGIDYINKKTYNESTETIIQCSAPKRSNNNTLRCDVGNPLSTGKIVKFKIYLQPSIFPGMNSSYELHMKVNSSNPEKLDTINDNTYHISLPLWVETKLLIEGKSRPTKIDFDSLDIVNNDETITDTTEFGPNIIHNYTIRNDGPSTIVNISTLLIWTAETFAGDPLLYLEDQLITSSEKIQCDIANVDYLNMKTNKNRTVRDIHDKRVMMNQKFSRASALTKYSNKSESFGLHLNNSFSDEFLRNMLELQNMKDLKDCFDEVNESTFLQYEYVTSIIKSVINDQNSYKICTFRNNVYVKVLAKFIRYKNHSNSLIEFLSGIRYPLFNPPIDNQHLNCFDNCKNFTEIIARLFITPENNIYFLLENGQVFLAKHKHAKRHANSSVGENHQNIIIQSPVLCKTAQCLHLKCYGGPIMKDEELSISVRFLLNKRFIKEVAPNVTVKLSSKLTAHVTSQTFIQNLDQVIQQDCEVFTEILSTRKVTNTEMIPLWIVVLSACIGTAILLLLIYILYKCGFFKRTRPTMKSERQPLHKSRHFLHSDN